MPQACIGLVPLPSVEEKDLDPNENGFDKSCVNVVGAIYFVRVMVPSWVT